MSQTSEEQAKGSKRKQNDKCNRQGKSSLKASSETPLLLERYARQLLAEREYIPNPPQHGLDILEVYQTSLMRRFSNTYDELDYFSIEQISSTIVDAKASLNRAMAEYAKKQKALEEEKAKQEAQAKQEKLKQEAQEQALAQNQALSQGALHSDITQATDESKAVTANADSNQLQQVAIPAISNAQESSDKSKCGDTQCMQEGKVATELALDSTDSVQNKSYAQSASQANKQESSDISQQQLQANYCQEKDYTLIQSKAHSQSSLATSVSSTHESANSSLHSNSSKSQEHKQISKQQIDMDFSLSPLLFMMSGDLPEDVHNHYSAVFDFMSQYSRLPTANGDTAEQAVFNALENLSKTLPKACGHLVGYFIAVLSEQDVALAREKYLPSQN